TAAAYEIRARFASAPPTSAEYVVEIWFDYLQEIVPDDFRFPNSALLAFRMPHPGHMPEVSCGVRRTLAPVWNPSTEAWEDKPLNNLAWMAWHVTHSRRGARVHESRILYDDFELAADWCDQKGITGSLYLDSAMDARTVWDHLGTLGRFRVVRKGTSIGVISDRPVDAPEQGLLSTDANSHVSSFGLGYLKSQDRADAVRITYFDKVKGRTTIQVLGEHYHNITNRSPVVRDMTMPVCDDNGVAVRAGRYWLRCNRYLVRTLSRTMRIEAIGCLPGHVIQVASDVAEWGISSRIKAVSETTVTLGRTVTLEPGLIYKIKVKHTDRLSIDGPGELHEERTIVGVAETTITDTLTLAEPWADAPGQPALDVVVSFGEADRYLRLYRVTRITRSSRHLRTIEALEYAPEIYEDEGEVPAPDPAATVVAVAGLQAAILDRLEDGLQKKVVQLLWHGRALKWYVFVRRIGDISWTRLGDTSSPTFNARNLEVGHYYDFVVSGTTNPGDGEAVTVDFPLGVLSGLIQQVSEYVGDVEELLFENVGGAVMAVQEVM
ncbi:MAG: phage tail protein, partial [Proteobacteria bacterium]|nr:phage tail protein [Pseudomonadota bacterium]